MSDGGPDHATINLKHLTTTPGGSCPKNPVHTNIPTIGNIPKNTHELVEESLEIPKYLRTKGGTL